MLSAWILEGVALPEDAASDVPASTLAMECVPDIALPVEEAERGGEPNEKDNGLAVDGDCGVAAAAWFSKLWIRGCVEA